MSHEPTVIYSAANTQQAHLLKGLLADRGIVARVVNDAIQIAGGELPMGWTAAARVVVAESDALVARQVAEEFDRQTAHHAPLPEAVEDGEQALAGVPTEWDQWPVCPT